MAEAGEVGHWSVLKAMNGDRSCAGRQSSSSGRCRSSSATSTSVMAASVSLAASEDPNGTA